MAAVDDLHAAARTFGRGAAREKLALLEAVAGMRLRSRAQRRFADVLGFLCAFPDDARVRDRARALAAGLPPEERVYEYSYGVVRRLVELAPGALEIAWEDIEDDGPLQDLLDLLVLPGEGQGLEDTRIGLEEWFDASRPAGVTHLEFLVALLEAAPLPPPVRVRLFESCELPIRYRGPSRPALARPVRRVHYQKRALGRGRFPLAPAIGEPLGRVRRGGRSVVDLALQALCVRELEIYPLIYANPEDVVVVPVGRGLEVALVGVLPEFRSPLESLYFFLVLKNGVPIAYGPASVFLGCCEMGINLFPEFRGGEVRYLYAQFMRVLHHRLGVDYFFLTPYGMGRNNPDAIASGAFWFYRKLGFRPTSPQVEELARAEEARQARQPGYRSDRKTLRRLARTSAYFDLGGGRARPVDFGRLGIAQSRFVADAFGGNRTLAERRCAARVGRRLGLPRDGRSLRVLAPLLAMIGDLGRWSARDRAALARAIRAKDARSEARAALLFKRHPRLATALRAIGVAD